VNFTAYDMVKECTLEILGIPLSKAAGIAVRIGLALLILLGAALVW